MKCSATAADLTERDVAPRRLVQRERKFNLLWHEATGRVNSAYLKII